MQSASAPSDQHHHRRSVQLTCLAVRRAGSRVFGISPESSRVPASRASSHFFSSSSELSSLALGSVVVLPCGVRAAEAADSNTPCLYFQRPGVTSYVTWAMVDLAGNANKAPTTASATMHIQGRLFFTKPSSVCPL